MYCVMKIDGDYCSQLASGIYDIRQAVGIMELDEYKEDVKYGRIYIFQDVTGGGK